jgi:hypothetical protein
MPLQRKHAVTVRMRHSNVCAGAAAALAWRDDEEPGRLSQTVQDSGVAMDGFFVPETIAKTFL